MKVVSETPDKPITLRTIEAAWKRRVLGKRLVLRDRECRGLALVVNPTSMAWTVSGLSGISCGTAMIRWR
jgi:hypothetical protein